MAEVVDELLVRLGLDSDQQSFQQAQANFAMVRRGAMSLAATVGAGLGLEQVTTDAAKVNDQLGLQADRLGVTAKQLDSFGYALARSGGEASNAVSLFGSANDAIDQLQMGNIPGISMASRWGLDPDSLMESADAMDFMLQLSSQLEGMNTQQQRNVLESLGLGGEAAFELLTGGRNHLEEVLATSQELSPTLQDLIDDSREFRESLVDLERSVSSVNNIIASELLDNLTGLSDIISLVVSENREGIAGAVSGAVDVGTSGGVPGMLMRNWDKTPIGFVISNLFDEGQQGLPEPTPSPYGNGQGGYTPNNMWNQPEPEAPEALEAPLSNVRDNAAIRAAVAQAEREIGAPEGLLWAQIGQESSYNPGAVSPAGAQGLAQIMPDTERSLEERMGRDLDPFKPGDAIEMQAALMRENFDNSGSWEEALRLYHGGYDRSQWGPVNESYAPAVQERMGGNSVTQTNTFNISGSDPQENAREVERVLRRTADQARQDTVNEVY